MVQVLLEQPGRSLATRQYEILRLLCKHRTELLAEQLLGKPPYEVRSGPFAGMVVTHATEGCLIPKVLGTYEQDLHPILGSLPQRGYEAVLNVGCAEGYYAVGLARLMPNVSVSAHDTDEASRQQCQAMAAANGVAGQVEVGDAITTGSFASFSTRRTLVICDIEGSERDLLDPETAPALRDLDLLVEVHEVFSPGVSDLLRQRFATSHDVEAIVAGDRHYDGSLPDLEHLDRLLCLWEWRLAGTDWLWLTSRRGARSRT